MDVAPLEVPAQRLRHRVEPESLPFATTAEITPLEGTIGQPRALDAVAFGLEIQAAGYNLFVVGAPGSGRVTAVRDHIERFARERPVPDDWVYVHNFADGDRPRAIHVPAGQGRELAARMDELVEAVRRELARALESDEYQKRRDAVVSEVEHQHQALRTEIERFAAERGFGIEITPIGLAVFPVAQGRPLTPEEVEKLSDAQRDDMQRRSGEIHDRLQTEARRIRLLEREGTERVRTLERAVALAAIEPLFAGLRETHAERHDVLDHLQAVQDDMLDHLQELRGGERPEAQAGPAAGLLLVPKDDHLTRYRVNVFVDNGGLRAAPVVIERSPTYYNLVGRVEYRARYGAMVTDFTEVSAGSLHRANGGFLVLEALDVLGNAFAWEVLKRTLRAREVAIENLAEQYSPVPTATLHPQPIPLDVKVVLVASPLLHRLLQAHDEDVGELFKVKVDFAPEMDWNDQNVLGYAAFIAGCIERGGLRHLDRTAIARVVEHGARLRENQRKLTTRLLEISDLVTEAGFWAGKDGRSVVTGEDVETAIRQKEYRSNLLEERVRELVVDRTIVIETEGTRAGQVNGLSILDVGDHTFGQASRITARVALGRGTVESIEREIDLSGPIHSKGFLILSGYLAQTYAQERPLALRATITFEQSYDEVDGDSASSAELYALLSALSGIPIRQGVAVTGSINQYGEVQAVGGVTRKVEGFFAVCRARGLTGEQGVIIPAANVQHLMLADDVVEACARGDFHVWAVSTVDEGLELLTGVPAGERSDGEFPRGTVHGAVDDRLRRYAESAQAFAVSPNGSAGKRHAAAAGTPVAPRRARREG